METQNDSVWEYEKPVLIEFGRNCLASGAAGSCADEISTTDGSTCDDGSAER